MDLIITTLSNAVAALFWTVYRIGIDTTNFPIILPFP